MSKSSNTTQNLPLEMRLRDELDAQLGDIPPVVVNAEGREEGKRNEGRNFKGSKEMGKGKSR